MTRTIAMTAFLLSFSVAAGAAGTAGSSASTSVHTDQSAQFKDIDANGDGSISKEEAKANARLSGNFSTLDKNQDGRLDNNEFAQSDKGEMGDRNRGMGGTPGSTQEFSDDASGSGASPDSRMNTRPGSGMGD